jgi:zinc/manganese transport system permease protein
VAGYVVGGVSYLAGILLSVIFDLPTGAIIVWTMVATAIVGGAIISDKRAR